MAILEIGGYYHGRIDNGFSSINGNYKEYEVAEYNEYTTRKDG